MVCSGVCLLNTPAHVIFSLALLGRSRACSYAVVIALGAIFPDLTMIVFYAIESLRGTPENMIWSERYFLPLWQNVFDLTNSIPLYAAGTIVAFCAGRRGIGIFGISALIHCILDFFVHHDDAHRHFYPLGHFRFQSPVSYWDPAHFGNVVGALEVAFFLVLAAWLWRVDGKAYEQSHRLRQVVLVTAIVYLAYLFFVVTHWMGL